MPLEGPSSTLCVVCVHSIDLFFSMNYLTFSIKGGVGKNDLWAPSVGNSWRTTDDIQDNWDSMISNIDHVR